MQEFTAAGHISRQRADAVDANGEEHHQRAKAADVALRQAAKLQMLTRAQRRFRHVEHGDGRQATDHNQPKQQRQKARFAGGIGDG